MPLSLFDDFEKWELPHPPISVALFLILEEAIRAAWEMLHKAPPAGFDLASATEDMVTQRLHEMLEDHVWNRGIVDGFDGEIFSRTVREPKVRNYNYEHLDKMPDLVVFLVDRPVNVRQTQDGIFIECKPVDGEHKLLRHYCDRGIARFVNGDYAWAMTGALMLGYVLGDFAPEVDLELALTQRTQVLMSVDKPSPCRRSRGLPGPVLVTTRHRRNFCYAGTDRLAPEIHLRHLWLRRN